MECHLGCLAIFTVYVAKKCRELEDSRVARKARQLKAAKADAIKYLQPELEPILIQEGLEWLDAEEALEAYNGLERIQAATADPSAFLEELEGSSPALAKKLATLRLKKRMEPILGTVSCEWSDVEPLVHAFETGELTTALSDPGDCLERLAGSSEPLNRKLLRGRLRPKLEPLVLAEGLDWNDAQRAMDSVEDVGLLESGIAEPVIFFEKLAGTNLSLNKKLTIARLEPELEPLVVKEALAWSDVELALDSINSIETLKAARSDPTGFFCVLKEQHSAIAKKLAVLQLKPQLEPITSKEGLEWSEVQSALDEFSKIEKIKHAVSFPEAFLNELASSGTPAAEKLAGQLKANRRRAQQAQSPSSKASGSTGPANLRQRLQDAASVDSPGSASSQMNMGLFFRLAHESSAAMNRRVKTPR